MLQSLPSSDFIPGDRCWNKKGWTPYFQANPEVILQTLEQDLPSG